MTLWLLSYLVLGAATGYMAGLLGIGGGGIMVPILVMLFSWQGVADEHLVHLALGTSMAAIVPTALASASAHHRRRSVDWRVAVTMTPGVLAGAFLATFIAAYIPSKPLAIFFAGFMTVIAGYMIWGRTPRPDRMLPHPAGLIGVGAGIGGVSSLVAIGGGSLTVPFLLWCNQSAQRAIGTSAALGIPIAFAGALGYIVNGWHVSTELPTLGFVVWPAVLVMASVSFMTAPLGAKLAHTLPVRRLKRIFALIMIALALKMLHGVW
ncbi:sulfite exporter TauE/SafE family protein [Gilvimarinus sp. SDUM040013]|uniref:Probable membrane transporter protein n=1 Tax=Gilvimarinus gilvus TaxID=3058038 RepID=A0ABU4RV93_9GAMM|nr:sulfite exporter TauE/SafE family protein [Gilvimarinus sp. SDUM040013]MDO3387842.1 sulfite exporter TauE/SafE family protein [Gilvimarinus sp. SDUM040013]MDX6848787.1 sulfite exporter TauE/SafE family protein [Gilvimarinus sp. SDUM040013]